MTKNLLLYQGEQILKSGVLRDLKVEVEQEVHSIEEFFNILFPTFDTLLEHADLTSKMNETISIKDQTEKGIEEDIDWNKIEWVSAGQEDAEQEDEDEDHEEEYTYPLALPQQIEFELKTSMQDIISDENKDIIESIRNLATHLINHSVPKLKSWKDIFTKVVVQYEEMIADSDVSNQPKKRSRGESSSSSAMPSSEHHQQQLETALHQANQALLIVEVLLEKIKAIITGKCKQLFAS